MTKHCFARYTLPLLLAFICLPASAQILKATQFVTGLAGANQVNTVAISPDGLHLYAFSDELGTLATFAIEQQSGNLTRLNVQNYEPELSPDATQVDFTPNGLWAYINLLNPQAGAAIELHSRNPSTGELQLVNPNILGLTETQTTGGITLSPDGAFLYVVIFEEDSQILTVFSVNNDGTLDSIQATDITELGNSAGEPFVPADGQHLYLNSTGDFIFSRNASTGTLSLVENSFILPPFTRLFSQFSNDGESVVLMSSPPVTPPSFGISLLNRNVQSGDLAAGSFVSALFTDMLFSQTYYSFIADDRFLIQISPHALLKLEPNGNNATELNLEIEDNLSSGTPHIFSTQAVSPNGRFYYRSLQDGISVFRIDPQASILPSVPALSVLSSVLLGLALLLTTILFFRRRGLLRTV